MYIYNVTVTLDESIHHDWIKWMKEIHIPDVMNTGLFTENRMCRVVTDEKEITYAIQYTFRKMDDLSLYRQLHAPRLQHEHSEKFGNKFAAFRTVLEIVA